MFQFVWFSLAFHTDNIRKSSLHLANKFLVWLAAKDIWLVHCLLGRKLSFAKMWQPVEYNPGYCDGDSRKLDDPLNHPCAFLDARSWMNQTKFWAWNDRRNPQNIHHPCEKHYGPLSHSGKILPAGRSLSERLKAEAAEGHRPLCWPSLNSCRGAFAMFPAHAAHVCNN